jgi:hypothetical protein
VPSIRGPVQSGLSVGPCTNFHPLVEQEGDDIGSRCTGSPPDHLTCRL